MKNKWIVNVVLLGLVGVICIGCSTVKDKVTLFTDEIYCIEYSDCLDKKDFEQVKVFLATLVKENKTNTKVFEKYLKSNMVDENGTYDKEVLFEFIDNYTNGRYEKNMASKLGTFSMSFKKKSDNGCGEYVYKYSTTPREGEYSTWVILGRDYDDGQVKIIQMGKAG